MTETNSEPEDRVKVHKDRVAQAREFFEMRKWHSLWMLKKQAKYSWERLGFTSREAERIKLNRPDFI